jgi:cell wall-associated NlpC family hydrolase
MTGAKIAATAEAQIGVDYKFGKAKPEDGFDCSGLAQYSHSQNGISIPRTAANQYTGEGGTSVETPEAGDLVFWGKDDKATHVGVMVNDTEVVDAPYGGQKVKKRNVWSEDLLGYRRYWSE